MNGIRILHCIVVTVGKGALTEIVPSHLFVSVFVTNLTSDCGVPWCSGMAVYNAGEPVTNPAVGHSFSRYFSLVMGRQLQLNQPMVTLAFF